MPRLRLPLAAGRAAEIVFTTRADGDLAIDGDHRALAARRAAIVDAPWTWLRQVHGNRVVEAGSPGERAGAEADAVVTTQPGVVLAAHAADCALVALVADDGALGVVHAGWRGIVEGVIAAAVEQVRARASAPVRAVLGPCIRPARYEFGADDLERVVAVVGDAARARTADGAPALDLPASVRAALAAAGVDDVHDLGLDTAHDDFFSHRLRGDTGRHALVAWIDTAGGAS